MLALDFFHADCAVTLTPVHVLFALEAGSRYVHILGTTSHPTAASTTQQARNFAERFVLTAKTELTDRILIFGERHLQTILAEYTAHYNGRRPHRAHRLRPPRPDHPAPDLTKQRIRRRPILAGLINEYEQSA